jgi:hypothetical protein
MPCAYVAWKGEVHIVADELLEQGTRHQKDELDEKRTKLQQAKDAIVELLTVEPGMWSDDVRKAIVEELGVGARTYESAHAQVATSRRGRKDDGAMGWRSYLKEDHGE